MAKNINRVHVDFDTDVSEFILRMVNATGYSAARCANILMRNIMSAEVETTVKMKSETPLPVKEGGQPVRFKKMTEIRIKI